MNKIVFGIVFLFTLPAWGQDDSAPATATENELDAELDVSLQSGFSPVRSVPSVVTDDEEWERNRAEALRSQTYFYGNRPLRPLDEPGYIELRLGGGAVKTTKPPGIDGKKYVEDYFFEGYFEFRPLRAETGSSWYLDEGYERYEFGFYAAWRADEYRTPTHKGYDVDGRLGLTLFGAHLRPYGDDRNKVGMTVQVGGGFTFGREANEARQVGGYELFYQNDVGVEGWVDIGFYRHPEAVLLTMFDIRFRIVEHLGEKLNDSLLRANGTESDPYLTHALELEGTLRLLNLGPRFLTLDAFAGWQDSRADPFQFQTGLGRLRVNEKVQFVYGGAKLTVRVYDGVYLFVQGSYGEFVKIDRGDVSAQAGIEVLPF